MRKSDQRRLKLIESLGLGPCTQREPSKFERAAHRLHDVFLACWWVVTLRLLAPTPLCRACSDITTIRQTNSRPILS
jgi:hypothetical protein